MPEQAAAVGPPGLAAAPGESSSGAAAQRAAAESCVTLDAQCTLSSEPSSESCSVDITAASSSDPLVDMLQGSSEGQPALARKLDWVGEQRSSGVRPAVGATGAETTEEARKDFLILWRALLDAYEPSMDALGAADKRVASLVAAAVERAQAAKMRTYPLPRMTWKCVSEKAAAWAGSAQAKTAAYSRVLDRKVASMRRVSSLQDSCASLIGAAHAAGLAWLSLSGETGPGLAAGQAWCAVFVGVSVGVHGASVQALTVVLPSTEAAMDALLDELAGVKCPLRLLLDGLTAVG